MVTSRASNLTSTLQFEVAFDAFLREVILSQLRYSLWRRCTYIAASEWLKLAEAFHHQPDALALAEVEDEKVSLELDCEDVETLRLI